MSSNYRGFNNLASVIAKEIEKRSPSDLVIDFGAVDNAGTLETVSVDFKIPEGQYFVCDSVKIREQTCMAGENCHGCDHCSGLSGKKCPACPGESIKGKKVLVAWIGATAVVVDTLS